ncbi:fibronectin type III domain-containing protein [Flavobacterium sp. CFBP9031]|uniref:fibronectin type III domain-containing protein n=1 Tax=Flavobacterium sp. CFBP9031 TaxID=3096538 RepID=UPI002A6B8206|nr:fibronectin type III domain-containing protein [Flavobacterium sp. CFBP9031]MDY0990262.1 fibronectin type III domain-containing protein [Flavobacterium sp. CFBP9031]
MGSLLQNTVFGKQKVKLNTFIGGVGRTLNTPALLASKLGITANRITLFRVTGTNVECAITGTFNLSWTLRTYGCTYFESTQLVSMGSLQEWTGENQLKRVIVPNMTYAKGATFYSNSGIRSYYCPLATNIGEYDSSNIFVGIGGRTRTFEAILPGFVLYCNPILATANAGGPVADINTILSRGGIVRYVTDFTKPESVTNLSVTSSYNTGFRLNFTPPYSLNGIDFYEVYANGIYQHDIKGPNDIVSGLEKNTNYNISIIAVDNFYNKSSFSNIKNAFTTNLDLDLDAQKFIDVSLNHDLSITVDNLVTALKNKGLWNKMHAVYPLIGDTSFQHKFNLKNPEDTNAAFRLVFNGSGNHSSNGYQTNGTNAYANTNIIVNSIHTFSDAGLTMVCGTNNIPVTTNSYDLGAQKKSTPWEAYQIHLNHGAAKNNNVFVLGTIGISKTAINNAKGIHTVSKTTNSEVKYFKNKNLDTVVSGTQSGVIPPLNYYIGCLNNGGGAFGYSNQRIQFTAFHQGLTELEAQTFHSIIDTFENNLNRKTW